MTIKLGIKLYYVNFIFGFYKLDDPKKKNDIMIL